MNLSHCLNYNLNFCSLRTAIQLADVNKGYPVDMDLMKLCPSLKDVQAAYEKLKELVFVGKEAHYMTCLSFLAGVYYIGKNCSNIQFLGHFTKATVF